VYYRNAKWLKELTQLAGREHHALVGMLDILVAPSR